MNSNWVDLLTDEHETLDIFIAPAIGANKRAIAVNVSLFVALINAEW